MTTEQSASQQKNNTTGRKKAKKPEGKDIKQMIAEAAYYRAEQRGFQGGLMDEDWYLAEAEIEAMLSENKPH